MRSCLRIRRVGFGASEGAVDCGVESCTDLAHALIAQAAQPLGECPDRDALDRIEVHSGRPGDWILRWLEDHLAGQPADGGGAWGDYGSPQPRNGNVSRHDDDRTAGNLRQVTPPDLTASGQVLHDNPAASRNEARSPHSSDSSIGLVSYAE